MKLHDASVRPLRQFVSHTGVSSSPLARWAACLTLALPLVASVAQAQAPARTIYFYLSGGGTGVNIGSWGNGAHSRARNVDYEGSDTLQVTTRNLNEGLRFDLNPPVEVGPYMANGYLRLRVRFGSGRRMQGGRGGWGGAPGGMDGAPGQFPGGPGGWGGNPEGFPGAPEGETQVDEFGNVIGGAGEGFEPGQMPVTNPFGISTPTNLRPTYQSSAQIGGPGGFQGGFPGGPGGFQGGPGGFPGGGMGGMMMRSRRQQTEISRIQVTMMLDRGVMSGGFDINLNRTRADDAGWRLFTLPIRDMRATQGAGGNIRRVILTTDKEETWYLAQAALVVETGEMTVSIRRPSDPAEAQISEITVKPGPISLVADVEAGAADPQVEWNFDADNVGNLPLANEGAPGMMGMPGMEGMPGMPGGQQFPGFPGAATEAVGPDGQPIPAGPRIDARGLVGKFDYPAEEQNYRVEVTVRDRSGKKQPVTSSILVKVRG
jgi:hypothetical protein